MLGNHLFTARFELARDRRPGIVRFDERTPRGSKRLAPTWIAEQPDDRVREIVRRVGGQEMSSRLERESLRADRRRHDRLAHRQRFKNLDARPAAGAQRHDIDRAFCNRRPYVIDGAGHKNTGLSAELANARARIAADDRERHIREFRANARQDCVNEVADRVLVRMPVHRPAEHQTERHFSVASGGEVLGVDTGRD